MPELTFEYCGFSIKANNKDIVKLSADDVDTYNAHLRLCGQSEISEAEWQEIYADGTVYYLLYDKELPVARAAIEKLSDDVWEIADVRTAEQFRMGAFVCVKG